MTDDLMWYVVVWASCNTVAFGVYLEVPKDVCGLAEMLAAPPPPPKLLSRAERVL